MDKRRVVITGLGPVTALGVGRTAFASALATGKSAIRPAQRIDTSACEASLAAEVMEFDLQELLESRKAYLDPSSKFALGAVALAIRDAGLGAAELSRAGICLGTAFGSMETLGMFFEGYLEKGPRFVKPFLFQHTYANTAIGLAAIEFGIRGPHLNVAGGLTAGANAIVTAHDLIVSGKADCVVTGGYDALSDYLYAGLDASGELCLDEQYTTDAGPLAPGRTGFVPGEGAGIVVLENLETARNRGAPLYAELAGLGMSGRFEGIADAMNEAAQAAPVDLVYAAANGSLDLDEREQLAIRAFSGTGTKGPVGVAVLKQLTGEPFAAGAAIQTIAACDALQGGTIPATIFLAESEFAPAPAGGGPVRAIVNSIDPGGSVVCLLLQALGKIA